jgi:hypothetical protein
MAYQNGTKKEGLVELLYMAITGLRIFENGKINERINLLLLRVHKSGYRK